MEKLKSVLERLLDYIYRKRCYFCGKSVESVRMCSKCYDELEFCAPKVSRIINGADIFIAGVYEKNIQKLIRGVKYHNQKELSYYQAKFMWEYFQEVLLTNYIKKDFQIVAVPLHTSRQRRRGYNHMSLVAKEFSLLSGYEVNSQLIKRVKNTKPQYKLNHTQRMENLKDAFRVDKTKLIPNKTVLIIDDICTTASTFETMINELNKNEIEDIVCLATSSPLYGDETEIKWRLYGN